jgi:VWFA-related protein
LKIRFLEPSLILAIALPLVSIAVEPPAPVRSGLVEKVDVNLVIVDVQVLDRKGNPVSGLSAGDFDVSVDHRPMPIASFDASCAELSEKPDIVLAFDYQHLGETQRTQALDSAQRALEQCGIRDAEIMVAALTGGLRVAQRFTTERDRIVDALRTMRNDPTLYAGHFGHISEKGFVRGLTALFDVAATVPKPKAILMYSAMQDVPLEEQFRQLSALASASRSVVYPVDMRGLDDHDRSGARDVGTPNGVG